MVATATPKRSSRRSSAKQQTQADSVNSREIQSEPSTENLQLSTDPAPSVNVETAAYIHDSSSSVASSPLSPGPQDDGKEAASNMRQSDLMDIEHQQVIESGRVDPLTLETESSSTNSSVAISASNSPLVAEPPSLDHSLHDDGVSTGSHTGSNPEDPDNIAADLEKRNQAFEVFKQLETYYHQLFNKVIQEKERDLARIEESVKNGTHSGLLKSLESARVAYQRSRDVADTKRHCQLQSNQLEYDLTLESIENSSLEQKNSLRRFMLYKLGAFQHELQRENQQNERHRIGNRIKMNPQIFHPAQKVRTVPYPVLEQYHWRRRQNTRALQSYETTHDQFGCLMPPNFVPEGLQTQEGDADLSFMRNAGNTLNQLVNNRHPSQQ